MNEKTQPRNTRNPQRTRQRILDAARVVFAGKGFDGARVDAIALESGVNKRMIYHYFGNKDGLFAAVLEAVYGGIGRVVTEARAAGRFDALAPDAAICALTDIICRYYDDRPEVVALVNNENLYGGRHVAATKRARGVSRPVEAMIEQILHDGVERGLFRSGVPARALMTTIIALGYYFAAQKSTLSLAFGHDYHAPERADAWRRYVCGAVARFVAAD